MDNYCITRQTHLIVLDEGRFNHIRGNLETLIHYPTPNYIGVGDFLLISEIAPLMLFYPLLKFLQFKTGRQVLCQVTDILNRDYLPVKTCMMRLTNLTHSDYPINRYEDIYNEKF